MNKKLLKRASASLPKLLGLMLLSLLPTQLSARDFEYTYEGQTLTYTVLDEDAKTVYTKNGKWGAAGNSVSGDLVVPEQVSDGSDTYSVTCLGAYTFFGCTDLSSVTIPNSVTLIDGNAFYNCSGLTSVTIGNSVTMIGYSSFQGCTSLTSVTIPNSVTKIRPSAFDGCTGLSNITLGNAVTEIGSYAFYECSKLTSIDIPNSVTSIGELAFSKSGLTSVILPNSVTEIGNMAFNVRNSLKKCAYPSRISNPFNSGIAIEYPAEGEYMVEDGCLWTADKTGLYFVPVDAKGDFSIPNSVTTIGNSAFEGCAGLNSVTIPNSVTTIGSRAFYDCSRLTGTINLNSTTSIGEYAFYNCSGLTGAIDLNSATAIGNSAFYECTGLTGTIDLNSATSIGEYTFYGCSGLTGVIIGNALTTIGEYAFYDCIGLTSVIIPNSVTTIGEYAFNGCSGLIKSAYPSSISKPFYSGIAVEYPAEGEYMVEDGCLWTTDKTGLYFVPVDAKGEFTIPNSVTTIGSNAFEGCTGLNSVTIPNSVTEIGDSAFEGCSGLTSVSIPNSVTMIGYNSFKGCSGLTSITIPDSVTEIGGSAFEGCSGLTSVIIPNSVTYIGYSAFKGCSGLTSISIPNSVTQIDGYAFEECTGLTSVIIPNSVTSFNRTAFSNCSNLKKSAYPSTISNPFSSGITIEYPAYDEYIVEDGCLWTADKSGLYFVPIDAQGKFIIPNSVTTIGNNAFRGCRELTSVIIPNSVTSCGTNAFNGCSNLKKSAYPSELENPFGAYGISVEYPAEGEYMVEDGYLWTTDKTGLYFVPLDAKGEFIIPNSVTTIGSNAFDGCTGLNSVYIPNSVTEIGRCAFYDCTGLTSVTIDNAPTSIGVAAFRGCSSLTGTINLNSVTSIGDRAFYECTGLTGAIYLNSVTSIGERAFYGCSGLTCVIIGNSAKSVGEYAFYGCSNLKKSAYPSGLSYYPFQDPWRSVLAVEYPAYGEYMVEDGCLWTTDKTGLYFVPEDAEGEFIIPNSVTTIGNSAFEGCNNLTSVSINNAITSIGDQAFYKFAGLTGTIILNSVTSIGNNAFNGCSGLTCVIIGNSATTVGDNAFKGCTGLKKSAYPSELSNPFSNGIAVKYPAEGEYSFDDGYIWTTDKTGLYFVPADVESEFTIPNSVSTIGNSAFQGCSGLTSVTIPNSVSTIGNSAFVDCPGLTSVTIDNAPTAIGDNAFYNCSGLTSINLNSVTSIGQSAFEGCNNLTSAIDLNSATAIGNRAFKGCSGLTSVTIGNSVTEIGEYAFCYCSGLASVTIGYSVTKIAREAFSYCSGLTSVVIPNSVTYLSYDAFSDCTGLKKSAYPSGHSNPFSDGIAVEYPAEGEYSFDNGYIWTTDKTGLYFVPVDVEGEFTLPVSLTTIGSKAFDGCDTITALNVESSLPAEFADNSFSNYDIDVTVPTGSLADYIVTDWSKFPNLKDASGITTPAFSDDVFKYRMIGEKDAVLIPGNYGSMTSVSIPERVVYNEKFVYVTAIANAFTDCSNMTSLVLPKRLTKILDNAFKGCTGLTEVNFPATLTTIGNNAFEGCTGLTGITFPTALTAIGNSAFKDCNLMATVSFPESLTEIGINAFRACTSLATVELPSQISTVSDSTFYGCSALTDVTFPESLTSIGNSTFEGCTKLTSATIPNAVTSIGDRAFYNCSTLAAFTPGESLEYVGESAFYGCTALTDVKVTWPDVAASTFANTGLRNLNFTGAVESIGEKAFSSTYLSAISIPSSVNSIANEAFANAAADNNGVALTLEDGLNVIDINRTAFNSTAIPAVYIGRELESYESFSSKVKKVDFGNAVTSIPANAFNGNSRLSTVNFGSSIETIGEKAFNGCALTELVLPPHVKTVGNNAFASNAIKNIAIGSEVTEIGEKAFDGANELAGVSITALTPPMANNNTFSYYDCPLYVTPGCVDTYYDFIHCWYRFSGYDLIPADKVEIEDEATITLLPGESLQLSAAVVPANASLPYIFWRSSNPEFATVDSEGNVTRVATSAASAQAEDGEDEGVNKPQSCEIYAETLYAGVVASILVKDVATEMVDIVTEDSGAKASRPNNVYNLQGICVKRNASQAEIDALTPGLYIIAGKKVLVK